MIKNNRGFIAISVIYSFVLVFLLIMLIIMNTYYNNRTSFNIYKDNIKVRAALGYTFEAENTLYLTDAVRNQEPLTNTSASGVRADGSGYGSYRYFGMAPNNYVCFGKIGADCNDKKYLFRIIGIFKESNVSATGGSGYVTKIMRASALSTDRVYNSSSNSWASSSLKTYLNNTYLNDATLAGFEDLFKNQMIINAKWYAPSLSSVAINAKTAYDQEMHADAAHQTQAKVGLLSVSDWGYAPQYTGRCASGDLMNQFNVGLDHTCYLYDWLWSSRSIWFIDAAPAGNQAMTLDNNANLVTANVNISKRIFPVFYLNSKVVVMAGSGTRVDPYVVNLLGV